MSVEITNIKIKLGEREIELTSDEARKVHAELAKLFGLEITSPMPYPVLYPFPYPVVPIVIEKEVPSWPQPWTITCGGENPTPTFVGQIQAYSSATLCIS